MRTQGLRAAVYDDGLALSHDGPQGESTAPVRLSFVGARRGAAIEPREASAARTHYLRGADPAQWLRDVPLYAQLRQSALYPGVDLVYYSRDGELEYDLVVQAGADPSRIRMKVKGAHPPRLAASGDLLLDGPEGALRLHRPLLYQNVDGQRKKLDGRYVMLAANEVGFELPAYDRTRPLIIDPTFKLLYSTYLTGFHDERVGGMALDAQGNAYVVGQSNSDDFVVSANAVQRGKSTTGLQYNVVVTKFDASGNLIYATYLGGTASDIGAAIAVDAAGNAYFTGNTTSRDYPVTAGAYQSTFKGTPSAFLSVLSPDGSALAYSSYFGGSGGAQATAIALDPSGAPVIAGSAGPGLPTTAGAYKTTLASGSAAFVARFNPLANGAPQLVAASYYGVDNPQANGSGMGNNAYSMALDASGAPWFTGQAFTTNLPLTTAALQAAPSAMSNGCAPGPAPLNSFAYLAKLSADLGSLAYASYLSGRTEPAGGTACSEFGRAITLDAAGNVYVAGGTGSDKIPTTAGALQVSTPAGSGFSSYVSFLAKLKPDGSALLWSTYFGGNVGQTFLAALALDPGNNALWAIGVTGGGSNYPISSDALQKVHGGAGSDVGIAQFDATSGALRYSSFHGGNAAEDGTAIGVDAGGNVFIAGQTTSTNFPLTANAYERTFRPDFFGGADWFFSVLGSGTIGQVRPAVAGNTGDVTLMVRGAGFQSDAVCALESAAAPLLSSSVSLAADGTGIECTFALAGAAPGSYDLAIRNPDGTRIVRTGAFTVQSDSSGSSLNVEVLGRAIVRSGVPSSNSVVVTNTGTADAYGVTLIVRFSAGLRPIDATKVDPFGLNLLVPPSRASDPGADYSQEPIVISSDDPGISSVPLFIPVLPAGRSLSLAFPLVAPVDSDNEYIEAEVWPAISDSVTELNSVFGGVGRSNRAFAFGRERALGGGAQCSSDGLDKIIDEIIKNLPAPAKPIGDCLNSFSKAIADAINAGKYQVKQTFGEVKSMAWSMLFRSALNALADCEPRAKSAKTLNDLLKKYDKAKKLYDKCNDKSKSKNSKKPTKSQGSRDPNDKSGPNGDGSAAHYLGAGQPLSYRIDFENQPSASLPAAEVVVSDVLDASKLDLSTLTLGDVAFGTHTLAVPPGLRSYATTYAIDATLSVRVQGSLNPATGLLKWTFVSIDPATGLPPSDPTLGFLPPDTDGVKGQGHVNFVVRPKAGLPDGSAFSNRASIVFDANAPILTPAWVNTLDLSTPVGRVASAVQKSDSTDVDVSWGATDGGSGAKRYTVSVSDNGGAYSEWQSDVTATSAVYAGTIGHRYDFYVVATDGAGNAEAAKSAAEASVTVQTASGGGGGGGGGGCTIGGTDQRDASLVLLALSAGVLLWRRRLSARSAASSQHTAPG